MGTDVRADPRVAAILNDPTLHPRDKEQRLDALNAQTGYQLWPQGYGLNIGTGEIYKDASMKRQLLRAGLSFAVPLAYGVATGGIGGAGAAQAGTAGGVLPSTSTIGMTGLPAGSAGGSIAGGISAAGAAIPGGAAAASAAPGWLGTLLSKGSLVNAGLNLAGNLVASHQVNKAVAAQQQAAQQQLALQKQMYDTTRGDLAPYRTLGAGAASSLGYLLGLPGAK